MKPAPFLENWIEILHDVQDQRRAVNLFNASSDEDQGHVLLLGAIGLSERSDLPAVLRVAVDEAKLTYRNSSDELWAAAERAVLTAAKEFVPRAQASVKKYLARGECDDLLLAADELDILLLAQIPLAARKRYLMQPQELQALLEFRYSLLLKVLAGQVPVLKDWVGERAGAISSHAAKRVEQDGEDPADRTFISATEYILILVPQGPSAA